MLSSIIIGGTIAGSAAVQTAFNQEYADIGVALERLDQSYNATIGGVVSRFNDSVVLDDNLGEGPDNIALCITAVPEN